MIIEFSIDDFNTFIKVGDSIIRDGKEYQVFSINEFSSCNYHSRNFILRTIVRFNLPISGCACKKATPPPVQPKKSKKD